LGSTAAWTQGHRDTFHFKDVAEMDQARMSIGHHGHTATTNEPLTISKAAIEMASPGHHASDQSNHHGSDDVSHGLNHAGSDASTHAQHHDLMV
jgi:hypothetical protein